MSRGGISAARASSRSIEAICILLGLRLGMLSGSIWQGLATTVGIWRSRTFGYTYLGVPFTATRTLTVAQKGTAGDLDVDLCRRRCGDGVR